MSIFNEVTGLFLEYVDLKARQYTTYAREETRRVFSGLLLFAASALFCALGLVFLYICLFFALSLPLRGLALPALYTGAAAALAGVVLAAAGLRVMRSRVAGSKAGLRGADNAGVKGRV